MTAPPPQPPPTSNRPPTAGPPTGPPPPFPLRVSGKVITGFGRGSKELGIPTANIPVSGLSVGGSTEVESGVYFGWAGLKKEEGQRGEAVGAAGEGKEKVYKMVMSIGWNPFYKNTNRSVEVHILHTFPEDFYGAHMKLLILGFVRPEQDYGSLDALIADIKEDGEVAKRSLDREAYASYKGDEWLVAEGGWGDVGN
ncbi:MAG: riboflavin kinase [Piccolia ochrophora]|nr:MAG: riboflavin kinase [Piccolia ochrophora]